MNKKGEIVIYKQKGKVRAVDVRLSGDTVWLNLNQMTMLFRRDKSVISRHIGNIYKEKELSRDSTIAKFATVQKEGNRSIEREIDYYNLDIIISVGYRVKSKRGTQFRIWATDILNKHLVKGYSFNEKRLRTQTGKIKELEKTVRMLGSILEHRRLQTDEAVGLLRVIHDYTYALDLLDQYDHKSVEVGDTTRKIGFKITYEKAIRAIEEIKKKYGGTDLFAREKDDSFKSSISTIYQTFSGDELYPGIEEKAAHLLYFIVKNHSFVDGNKRVAAFIFVWFLDKNKLLYKRDGNRRIENNALVALTLMIAESKPEEKDMIIKIIINLINKNN